jgi:hypothetical protein
MESYLEILLYNGKFQRFSEIYVFIKASEIVLDVALYKPDQNHLNIAISTVNIGDCTKGRQLYPSL